MKKRVMVGLSGGVDSSVSAALLVEQGYDVVGVTLKLYNYSDLDFDPPDGACCSVDLIDDARLVCSRLNVPHYVVDLTEPFEKRVIEDFIESYTRGRTPNPCINCNRFMKWGEMLKMAEKLSCDFVATGHYARIGRSNPDVSLLKGLDSTKDQSYALWSIGLEAFSRTLFPLGELTKNHVRNIAAKHGFKNADRPESQEICFVPHGRYSALVEKRRGKNDPSLQPGPIYDFEGRQIGKHSGYANYTIGQRRGLGISSPEPLYVARINPADNSIFVGTGGHLLSRKFTVVDINLLVENSLFPDTVDVKIRYRHQGSSARIAFVGNKATVTFDRPERAITPGQSAVFYSGDRVLGGGIIDEVFD